MNALGVSYLVLCGVALVLATVHVAQAIIIRSDRTQAIMAATCAGFGLFDLGIAFSSQHTGAAQPAWLGWHLLAAGSAAVLVVVVPMVAWSVLELPITPVRRAFMAATIALGATRLVGVLVLALEDPLMTWERLHSLDHAWIAFPSIGCALIGGGSWVVEGALAARRDVRYARSLFVFGLAATAASLHGVGVTLGLVSPPDVFGLLTLPAVGFVQALSTVRFVQAIQTANQPAGDMARYEVLGQLGAGGMGSIFLARRRGPAGFLRDVVLKTLRAGDDATGRERFLAEARVAAQLKHPNIVDVYDLGEQPGGFFIVMEHIAGVTLNEVAVKAKESGPLPPEVVAELGAQMCRALSFAHAARVIHRDIKRQNVMVSFAGVLKVIDFGIAKEVLAGAQLERAGDARRAEGHGLTEDGGVIGTPGYIAPERYLGEPATVASDLFAVGVVLYELLALASPFSGTGALSFSDDVRARRFEPLESARPGTPPALARAIERCLEPKPADRPPSAAALQAMLEEALGGRRVDLAAWLGALFPDGRAPLRRAPEAETTIDARGRDAPTAPARPPRA